MDDLQQYRADIDRLDRQIAALFEERMDVCRKVGAYKQARGLPVLDAGREQEVLEARAALMEDEGLRPLAQSVFEAIMAASRTLQAQLVEERDPDKAGELAAFEAMRAWKGESPAQRRVLYQGQPGAYCEAAAMDFFGHDCERMNLKTWDGVFRGVKEGFGDYGVVPIENSSTGSISEVYDLLGQFGCYIVGEQVVPVVHCLMALPGADVDAITDVYTHEQGFRQCAAFLRGYPGWTQHEWTNTALAARFVAESGDRTKAAIAGRRAAELYGLEILQTGIQQSRHNFTRFIVVAAQPDFPAEADKISVRFRVPHVRGSLSRILQILARAGLNLNKLESRPVPGENWQYDFYADFTGSLAQAGMERVIRELIDATLSFRVLGNYRAAAL